jgi:hypothetical protein
MQAQRPTPVSDSLRTARTTLKRRRERAAYERQVVEAILDEALICHLGFTVAQQPYVIPTTYARIGDTLYLHGAAANRMLTNLAAGVPACVTVTLVDGLVLARSAFHHSMNYRSVVLLGTARAVTDLEEKRASMEALVEHVIPGRQASVRAPSDEELATTLVLALPIHEASAKVRTGAPIDDEADMILGCWAGEIPLRLVADPPRGDPALTPGIVPDPAARAYQRPGWPMPGSSA